MIASTIQQIVGAVEQTAAATLNIAQTGASGTVALAPASAAPISGTSIARMITSATDATNSEAAFLARLAREIASAGVSADVNAIVDDMCNGAQVGTALALAFVALVACASSDPAVAGIPSGSDPTTGAMVGGDPTAALQRLASASDARTRQIALSDLDRIGQLTLATLSTIPKPKTIGQSFVQLVPAVQRQIDGSLATLAQTVQQSVPTAATSAAALTIARLRAAWLNMTRAVQISAARPAALPTTSLPVSPLRV